MNKMEVLFGIVSSGLLAYILSEVKELRREVNRLENKLIVFEKNIPKRKSDHTDFTLG